MIIDSVCVKSIKRVSFICSVNITIKSKMLQILGIFYGKQLPEFKFLKEYSNRIYFRQCRNKHIRID